MRKTCEHCRFAETLRQEEPEVWSFLCKRYAPRRHGMTIPGVKGRYQQTIWPKVMFDDWCGEYEPRALEAKGE